MKKRKSSKAALPANLLVGDSAAETISRCRSVAMYVMITAPNLADHGSNAKATDGLSLVMETLVDALEAVEKGEVAS